MSKKNKQAFGIDPAVLAQFDWSLARDRVINDMKSDFIYAPHIGRIFRSGFNRLKDTVEKELKNGEFSPSLPITIDVPKSTRMRALSLQRLGPTFSRPGSILMPKDRLLYQILADSAAPIVDKHTNKERSFSHWPADSGSMEKMFLPSRVCWNNMQNRLKFLSDDKAMKYVIKADVANCFTSINQHVLINFLKHCGYNASLLSALENMLVKFTGDRSSRGIVQGIFPSDLFGNFYLTPIDNFFEDHGIPSVRYVDDIFVFVSNFDAAERLVRSLSSELRSYSLFLNEAKSHLMPKGALITEEPDLEALFSQAIEEVENSFLVDELESDYGFQSEYDDENESASDGIVDVKLKATENLFDSLKQYIGNEEKIERFCLPLFARAKSDYAVDYVIENFATSPSMAQMYCIYLSRFLSSEGVSPALEYLLLSDELYFDWQKMWILAALLTNSSGSDEVSKWCLDIVKNQNCHESLKAVSAIYVCKFGSFPRRKSICSQYSDIGSPYVQSAILYGAHYFQPQEKSNAISSWGSHSLLHSLVAECI